MTSFPPPPARSLPPPPTPYPAADPWGDRAPGSGLVVSKLWWVTAPLLAVLVAAISFVLARPAPYVALMPGSARSVEPLVTVKAVEGGPEPLVEAPDDDLFLVTVSVRRPSNIEALYRLLDDANEVVPKKLIDGSQSREESRQFNLQLMTDSKDKAKKVALERVGYEVVVKPTGAVVIDADPSYPVAEVVRPGETIVGADGEDIANSEQLRVAIAAHRPGEAIELTVEPFGDPTQRQVSVELGTNPETKAAQLGVSLEDRPSYEFPIDVDIDSGDVGGPSAGLAFTLAIIDRLTPGSLTGDARVAVTGTIGLDGSVGPVGGVPQKTEAAIQEGAKVFLVPPDEFADAEEAAGGRLEVRKVTSLDDALAALEDLGGDPLPAAGSGPPDADSGG